MVICHEILLFGGYDIVDGQGGRRPIRTDRILIYDTITMQIRVCENKLPLPLSGHVVTHHSGKLTLYSGSTTNGLKNKTVFSIPYPFPAGEQWTVESHTCEQIYGSIDLN